MASVMIIALSARHINVYDMEKNCASIQCNLMLIEFFYVFIAFFNVVNEIL